MNDPLENQLRFLRDANTENMPHSERGLFDHLLGTRQLLLEWDARPAVCDAGLFHSIYGTEHYEAKAIPTTKRDEVRQVIGEEAEALAWLFGVLERESFDENLGLEKDFMVRHRLTGEHLSLSVAQFHDLVTMSFANTLEAFPRLRWIVRRNCRAYLRRWRAVADPRAQRAFDRYDTPAWKFWK